MAKQIAPAFNYSSIIHDYIRNLPNKENIFSILFIYSLIFRLHVLCFSSHQTWGYIRTMVNSTTTTLPPPFHPCFLAKIISEHLVLWHYLGFWHSASRLFFLMISLLKQFRPTVVFWLDKDICITVFRWPLDNQTVLSDCHYMKIFMIFWKFWCSISAKVESKYWPLPVNILRDYLFQNSHWIQLPAMHWALKSYNCTSDRLHKINKIMLTL